MLVKQLLTIFLHECENNNSLMDYINGKCNRITIIGYYQEYIKQEWTTQISPKNVPCDKNYTTHSDIKHIHLEIIILST